MNIDEYLKTKELIATYCINCKYYRDCDLVLKRCPLIDMPMQETVKRGDK